MSPELMQRLGGKSFTDPHVFSNSIRLAWPLLNENAEVNIPEKARALQQKWKERGYL